MAPSSPFSPWSTGNTPVVYSREEPLHLVAEESQGRHAPGSVSFVPPVVGLILAGEVIKHLAKGESV